MPAERLWAYNDFMNMIQRILSAHFVPGVVLQRLGIGAAAPRLPALTCQDIVDRVWSADMAHFVDSERIADAAGGANATGAQCRQVQRSRRGFTKAATASAEVPRVSLENASR